MNLESICKQLVLPIPEDDTDLLDEMNHKVQSLGQGQFLQKMGDILHKYEHNEPIRPHFPNKMQFIYMRDRQTFTFALFPELLPIAYQAGRAIGAAFDAPRRTGVTLQEALASAIDVADNFDYGHQEIVKIEDNFAIYRTYECADCYGMANIGMCICVYEAGIAAGALETSLGKHVRVKEVRCIANGDAYDEFEVFVENL
jgi:Predicted hydrocarbon binding protein (contains V4R domain)